MCNGIDLLCSMIDSAAVSNQQSALRNVHTFVPLILSDRIQLANLIGALLARATGSHTPVFPDARRLAVETIEKSKFIKT